MIHDVLLSCLNLYSKKPPIEEFLLSDPKILHPSEKKILLDIINVINVIRGVAKFARIYANNNNAVSMDEDELLQNGLYLKAFADGVIQVLNEYISVIANLEHNYLNNPTQSLLFIYQKLQVFEPLALFVRKLILTIQIQKLHGCAIIQHLHQSTLHGDKRICRGMKIIQSSVNVVFFKQLTHWILYAKVVDLYGEFFIQYTETHDNSTIGSERGTSTGSGRNTLTTVSDTASTYADIWRYEIHYDLLPPYLPYSWAEKVLFIGQTVLIFKVDANKIHKNAQMWNALETDNLDVQDSLWNEKEYMYFEKIQELHDSDEINVSHYESVIDEIKSYVTTRLSEIAINQADLVHQLRLIKDFFLLGRGELFLEFIRQTYITSKIVDTESKYREIVNSFEAAAHSVGVSEDLDQFSLSISKSSVDSADVMNEFGYLQYIQLQYKIIWPLHLLFSPKVLERYNVLFRFLLLLKKMQYDLHMLWCKQTRQAKIKNNINVDEMNLRNQLMFFIHNLQYYIQVDVLESQFSMLLNTILSKADFEEIQRAHSVFQANVLSLCFLISDEDVVNLSMLQSTTTLHSNNPVYVILNDIFYLCQDVCVALDVNDGAELTDITVFEEKFANLIEQLLNLLVGLKASPSTTSLSQLLLRLDFNHWFSEKKKRFEVK